MSEKNYFAKIIAKDPKGLQVISFGNSKNSQTNIIKELLVRVGAGEADEPPVPIESNLIQLSRV